MFALHHKGKQQCFIGIQDVHNPEFGTSQPITKRVRVRLPRFRGYILVSLSVR